MRRIFTLLVAAGLGLVVGCKRSAAPAKPEPCEVAVRHVMALGLGQADGVAQADPTGVFAKALETCRKEGLSQEQAACILAAKTDSELLNVRTCPAIAAKRPGWIVVAPTDAELSEVKDMLEPPVGPKSSSVLYRQLVAKDATSCGLLDTGAVQCWGQRVEVPAGTFAQLGWRWHLCGLSEDRKLTCAPHYPGEDLSFLPGEPLTAFSEGAFHGCGVVAATGALSCWSKEGWQGDGTKATPPPGKFTHVASGAGFSCAIKADKSVACFGPTAPPPPKGAFRGLAVMGTRACGLRADGTATCWGGDPIVASDLVAAIPAAKLTQLSCGERHCCGLQEDGAIACWGDTDSGRTAAPPGKFTTVAAADSHTCASGASSTVCWGNGALGQTTVPVSAGDHTWRAAP